MNKNIKYYLNLPYKTILEYEPDDKTWVAYCPELGRGTCYAISESKSEALNLLEKTKKIILEYAINEGKEIPEPVLNNDELPSGNFIVRVPRTMHRKLKAEAEAEGVSLNQYVLSVLSESLGLKVANSIISKTIESEFIRSGFNYPDTIKKMNSKDPDVKTLIRRKNPKSSMDKEEVAPKSGFVFEGSGYKANYSKKSK